jgi:hypothetical protein
MLLLTLHSTLSLVPYLWLSLLKKVLLWFTNEKEMINFFIVSLWYSWYNWVASNVNWYHLPINSIQLDIGLQFIFDILLQFDEHETNHWNIFVNVAMNTVIEIQWDGHKIIECFIVTYYWLFCNTLIKRRIRLHFWILLIK